jgi:hypothetical protein
MKPGMSALHAPLCFNLLTNNMITDSSSELALLEVSSPFASGASSPVALPRSLQARAIRMCRMYMSMPSYALN